MPGLFPRRSRHTRTATALVTVLLAVGSAACAGHGSAADLPGCVVLDHLSEHVVGTATSTLGGPYPSVGDSATRVALLYDAGHTAAATVYGKSHVRLRRPDGHLLAYADDKIEFRDGTVQAQGFYDLTDRSAGRSQFIPAIGTTGSFRGKLGRIAYRPARPGGDPAVVIAMCPAGMLK